MDTAVRAGTDYGFRLYLIELVFLALEHFQPYLVSALVGADATACATTPVHLAGIRHLDEVVGEHVNQVTWLIDDAATTRDLARVMIGQALAFFTGDLKSTILAEIIEYFEDMPNLETEWFTDQVRSFPAYRHIGVATFRADHGFYFEFLCSIDDTLYQHFRDVSDADLDTTISRFKSF